MATQDTPPYWDSIDDAISFATTVVGLSTSSANAAMRLTADSVPNVTQAQELFEQVGAEVAHALAMMEVSSTIDTTTLAHKYVRARVARLFGGRLVMLRLASQNRDIPAIVAKLVEDEQGWIESIRTDPKVRNTERAGLVQQGAVVASADPALQRNASRSRMVWSNWVERTNTTVHTRPPEPEIAPTPLEPMYGGVGEQE